jgi:hypothetical protein
MGDVKRMYEEVDSLRGLAVELPRRERKEIESKANEIEFDARELELQANQMSSLDKQLKYRANLAALRAIAAISEEIDDVRINGAKTLMRDADRNLQRAQDNRLASENPELSRTQKQSLIAEAENLELIALKQQADAMQIYQDVNPVIAELGIVPQGVSESDGSDEQNETDVAEANPVEEVPASNNVTEEANPAESISEVAESGSEEGTPEELVSETDTEENNAETNIEVDSSSEVENNPNAEETLAENPDTQTEESNEVVQYSQEATTPVEIVETPEQNHTNLNVKYEYRLSEDEDIRALDRKTILQIDPQSLSSTQRQEFEQRRADFIGVYVEDSRQTNASFYSANNPIQVVNEMPQGLVYKVQIAALRRKISGEQLPGVKPIVMEEIEGSAFIRYMAGLFTDYDNAMAARNEIRRSGYRDAFVVAYYNGQRISNAEARRLIQNGTAYTDQEIVAAAESVQQSTYVSNTESSGGSQVPNTNFEATESGIIPVASTSDGQPGAGNFEEPELFYAVQVGVYGSPRTNVRLNNLPDLYYGRMSNGYYRYFSGKFIDLDRARDRRAFARANGFPDAYIVAYYQGEKISVRRAQEIMPTLNLTVPAVIQQVSETESANNNSSNSTQTPRSENSNQQTSTEEETEQRPVEEVPDDGPVSQETTLDATVNIQFKVQLGAYRNDVPLSEVSKLIAIASRGVEQKEGPNGLTLFLTGNFDNLQDAVNLKNEIVLAGIPDAFVVAYNGNERISIDEAQHLLNR